MSKKILEQEGIPQELVDSLSIKNLGNPVQLQKDDEPVYLHQSSKGFWVSVNQELVKDEKGQLLVVSNKDALIARARYLNSFEGEALAFKIKLEVAKVKSEIDRKLDTIIQNMDTALFYAGKKGDTDSFSSIILSAMKNQAKANPHRVEVNEALNQRISISEEVVTDDTVELYNKLVAQKELKADKDYDMLYNFIFPEKAHLIASFKKENWQVLVDKFSRHKLDQTIEEINSKPFIETVAEYKVLFNKPQLQTNEEAA